MRRGCFVWSAVLALFLDQVSKIVVYGMLVPGDSMRVIGSVLRFLRTENNQGVFGWSYGPAWIYYVLPLLGIVLVFWFALRSTGAWPAIAYGLILGGAVGNLVDRIRLGGRVIDFIDVGWRGWHWYTFNLADAFVVAGIIMLAGREFLWRPKPATAPAEPAPPTAGNPESSDQDISRQQLDHAD